LFRENGYSQRDKCSVFLEGFLKVGLAGLANAGRLFPFRQNMTTIVLHRKMSGSISAESGVQ
jgi:hypothetical protein